MRDLRVHQQLVQQDSKATVDLFGVAPRDLLPNIQRGNAWAGGGELRPCKRCMRLARHKALKYGQGLCEGCRTQDAYSTALVLPTGEPSPALYWDDVAYGVPVYRAGKF